MSGKEFKNKLVKAWGYPNENDCWPGIKLRDLASKFRSKTNSSNDNFSSRKK